LGGSDAAQNGGQMLSNITLTLSLPAAEDKDVLTQPLMSPFSSDANSPFLTKKNRHDWSPAATSPGEVSHEP
jgi:hypothetical protein